jgi:hypothetical protein
LLDMYYTDQIVVCQGKSCASVQILNAKL